MVVGERGARRKYRREESSLPALPSLAFSRLIPVSSVIERSGWRGSSEEGPFFRRMCDDYEISRRGLLWNRKILALHFLYEDGSLIVTVADYYFLIFLEFAALSFFPPLRIQAFQQFSKN